MTLGEKALEIALTQIGKEEVPRGSNWGIDVQKYLHSVGIDFPASWCMAFIYWCFDQACDALGRGNPLFKTGGVLKEWNLRQSYKVTSPQTGDVFIMNFGDGLGHTGIVEKVDDSSIYTVEGNSNNDGSRNGYEVVRHKRIKTDKLIKGYLRF